MKLITLALFILPTIAICQNKTSRSTEQSWDDYIQRYVSNGDFSGNVLIVKDQTVLFQRSYGKANYELNVPTKSDTKFRIASVSKTFTAAAIVILANQGLLKYSDKLSTYIPGFIQGDSITIANLLLHQSGVADIDYDKYSFEKLSKNEVLDKLETQALYFKPGTASRYSNTGYFILAHIIEKVSGISYDEFLSKNIFQKLGMHNTGIDHNGQVIPSKSTGYGIGAGVNGIAQASWSDIDLSFGSGSIYSTADDLVKWLKAINNNTLFDINKMGYPFGWGARKLFADKNCLVQSGFLSGYSAFISVYPAEKLYVVALSNISSNFNEQAGNDLAAIYFKENYSMPEIRTAGPTINPNNFAGKYSWPGYKEFYIEQKDEGLSWRFTDEKTGSPLASIAENVFLLRLMNTKIIFHKGADGKATELVFGGGADSTTCKRIE